MHILPWFKTENLIEEWTGIIFKLWVYIMLFVQGMQEAYGSVVG
jgi:hypothetical protein